VQDPVQEVENPSPRYGGGGIPDTGGRSQTQWDLNQFNQHMTNRRNCRSVGNVDMPHHQTW